MKYWSSPSGLFSLILAHPHEIDINEAIKLGEQIREAWYQTIPHYAHRYAKKFTHTFIYSFFGGANIFSVCSPKIFNILA